jgi:hypothetical protein
MRASALSNMLSSTFVRMDDRQACRLVPQAGLLAGAVVLNGKARLERVGGSLPRNNPSISHEVLKSLHDPHLNHVA